jgi:S-adenosylmethionine uptake transporter
MAISDNLRGVAYMCLSMLAFTVNDSFVKAITAEVPLFQTVFLRGLIAIAGLAVMGSLTGGFRQRLHGADWRLITLRSVAEIFATITFLTALLHMLQRLFLATASAGGGLWPFWWGLSA